MGRQVQLAQFQLTFLIGIDVNLCFQGLLGCASFCHNPQCLARRSSWLHQPYTHVNDVLPCALLLKPIPERFRKLMHAKPQGRDLLTKHPAAIVFLHSSLICFPLEKSPSTPSVVSRGNWLIAFLPANAALSSILNFWSCSTNPTLLLAGRWPYNPFRILMNKSHFKTNLLTFVELTGWRDGAATVGWGGCLKKMNSIKSCVYVTKIIIELCAEWRQEWVCGEEVCMLWAFYPV